MRSISRTLCLLLLLSAIALVSCRSDSMTSASEVGIEVELSVEPNPAVVGEALLEVTLSDADGEPLKVNELTVRGDMNHAGMAPVIREVNEVTNGAVEVPFEWTMGGDWIVTVMANLPDNQSLEQTFELYVASDSMTDGEMDGMAHKGEE